MASRKPAASRRLASSFFARDWRRKLVPLAFLGFGLQAKSLDASPSVYSLRVRLCRYRLAAIVTTWHSAITGLTAGKKWTFGFFPDVLCLFQNREWQVVVLALKKCGGPLTGNIYHHQWCVAKSISDSVFCESLNPDSQSMYSDARPRVSGCAGSFHGFQPQR